MADDNADLKFSLYKLTDETKIDDILDAAKISTASYQEQSLSPENSQHKLFYARSITTPTWKNFARRIVLDDQEISLAKRSSSESYCLIINIEDASSLYAVTGGFGHNLISKFIDDEFGIDVLSRLVKSDDKALKSTREQSITGGLLGQSKFFRNDLDFYENESFGQFYRELQAKVTNEIVADKFGLELPEKKKDVVCTAKSSFKFNVQFDFETLISVIGKIEEILETDSVIDFNNVRKIIKSKEPELIDSLIEKLEEQLWSRFSQEADSYPFDICHPDFESYKTAIKFVVVKKSTKDKILMERNCFGDYEFDELYDFDELTSLIKEKLSIDTKKKLLSFLRNCKIVSYDENDNELTSGNFFLHIFGDVPHDNHRYFYIDKNWYEIKASFVELLNESVANLFRNKAYKEPLLPWGEISEGEYNEKYVGREKTLVLDRVLPNNIELCDLMIWDDNNLYLIHVKEGFGNKMRDLSLQISVSARLCSEALNTQDGKAKLESYYDAVVQYNEDDAYRKRLKEEFLKIPKDVFLRLFDKRLHFVLAVKDKSDRDFTEMEKFNSTIAKFSTKTLMENMSAKGHELEVVALKTK